MNQDGKLGFSPEIAQSLQYYVYRLIDPRNGETFYVGKGKGNRVFAHCAGELAFEGEDLEQKYQRIRDIRRAGFDVAHVIHRHGLDERTAMEVEGALIDAYPGLTNKADGFENSERGVMHAREIIELYAADEARFLHKALLISINRTANTLELYDATRHAWRIDPKKAQQAEVVLATDHGLIIEAFVADRWLEATVEHFPGFPAKPGRWGFVGHPAPLELAMHYKRKRVPDNMRKKGSANPIRYTY